MNKKTITFLVITYNQEKYILYTLESIKYQKNHFLQNYDIQLIIADDASTDRTTEFAKRWIDENKELFFNVIYNRNEKNKGISKNLRDSFKDIKGELVKLIAGDDMLPANSICPFLESLKEYDMVIGLPIYFWGNEIHKNPRETVTHIEKQLFGRDKSFLERMDRDCFIHGSSIYARSGNFKNRSVVAFMEKFVFLEDYPMFYAIGECNPKFSLCFKSEIAILYRRTENSACFIRKDEIKRDRQKMARYIFRKKGTTLYNKLVKLNEYLVFFSKSRVVQKYGMLDNYIQKIAMIKYRNTANQIYNAMYSQIRQNRDYLSGMNETVRKKMKEYMGGEGV